MSEGEHYHANPEGGIATEPVVAAAEAMPENEQPKTEGQEAAPATETAPEETEAEGTDEEAAEEGKPDEGEESAKEEASPEKSEDEAEKIEE